MLLNWHWDKQQKVPGVTLKILKRTPTTGQSCLWLLFARNPRQYWCVTTSLEIHQVSFQDLFLGAFDLSYYTPIMLHFKKEMKINMELILGRSWRTLYCQWKPKNKYVIQQKFLLILDKEYQTYINGAIYKMLHATWT